MATHSFDSTTYPLGNGHRIGRFELPLARFTTATRLELVVASADGAWRNSWPVWIFPASPAPAPPADLVVLDSPGPALREALAAGRRVLPLPARAALATPIDARFIDKYNRNALPAALWEAKIGPGKLLVCTLDITSDLDNRHAARQLRRSLLEYLGSDRFQPSVTLAPAALDPLFKSVRFRATADNAAPEHPVEAAVDGDPSTFWHTEWQSGRNRLPASLAIDLGADAGIRGFRYTPRQDMNRGRIDRYLVELSRDGRTWKPAAPDARFPDSADPQEIHFAKPIVARHIRLTALSDHGAANGAAIAGIEPLPDLSADSRKLAVGEDRAGAIGDNSNMPESGW